MKTADYYDILQGCADLCGLDREKISTAEQAIVRALIAKRLVEAWIFQRWPDLCACEKRYWRDAYDAGTAYAAGAEVYFTGTKQYYLALTATTGNAPADSSGTLDATRWALAQPSYSADNYSGTRAYVAGDQVYDPDTDLFYQARGATTGNLPTDTNHWGLLAPFERYVALEQTGKTSVGSPLEVWDQNPRIYANACRLLWKRTQDRIAVLSCATFGWVEFRLPAPVLWGSKWSVTGIYQAGDQVFYRSAAVKGNMFDCLATTAAGESPETTPAKWAVVEIPRIFRSYLEFGAAADFLTPQGEDEAGPLRGMADGALADQAAVFLGQEGGSQRTEVGTR